MYNRQTNTHTHIHTATLPVQSSVESKCTAIATTKARGIANKAWHTFRQRNILEAGGVGGRVVPTMTSL